MCRAAIHKAALQPSGAEHKAALQPSGAKMTALWMWEERWQPLIVAVWVECFFNVKDRINLQDCRDLLAADSILLER